MLFLPSPFHIETFLLCLTCDLFITCEKEFKIGMCESASTGLENFTVFLKIVFSYVG